MNSYINAWKQYAKFSGRTTRWEYVNFWFIDLLIIGFLSFLAFVVGPDAHEVFSSFTLILFFAYIGSSISPRLAIASRRMHDTGRAAWHLLRPARTWKLLTLEGMVGDNQYGPDPYGVVLSKELQSLRQDDLVLLREMDLLHHPDAVAALNKINLHKPFGKEQPKEVKLFNPDGSEMTEDQLNQT